MVGDRPITSAQTHVACLPLAEIPESSVFRPFVGVPMAAASRTCEREYERMTCRRADTALHLAAKFCVNINAAVVGSSYLEIVDRHGVGMPHAGVAVNLPIQLTAGSYDKTVKLWDMACGEARRVGYLCGTWGGAFAAALLSAMIWRRLSMPSWVKAGTPSSPMP